MPVKRMGGKTAFVAAVTRLGADLFADHVAQQQQALFCPAVFGVRQMVIHQPVEYAHGRMALQLTVDVHLHHVAPLMLFDNLRQHQLGGGAGVFLHATLEEVGPILLLIRQVLVALVQHRQGFADQFLILLSTRCSDSIALP